MSGCDSRTAGTVGGRSYSEFMRCTAPSKGHRTSSGAAACPVHGRSSYRPNTSYSSPGFSRDGGRSRPSGGSGGSHSARPRWSPANSPVAYTSDEVATLDRYRRKVEAVGPRTEYYDLFVCRAWDDRRKTATDLHNLLETEGVSVWFSEKDIILGQPFMREIDKGLAKTRIGLVLITPAFLRRVESGGYPRRNSRNCSHVTC
ncbi:toll/interleukin-1 receptor domain-containing protein [Cryptosporangium sp. NPDC048952]|uniref:toll/interleukin-1 receptor domain-containing protein n=1 Tax=Cryptosporangium sp. NPDC048952 TaxID=3363961 RepID=UPI00371A3D4F